MCGITGVVGDLWERDKEAFIHLLKLDVMRGHHSTGVLKVFENNHTQIVKSLGTTWDLLKDKPSEFYGANSAKYIQGNIKVLMGHNRWATTGEISVDNAHPFQSGDIIGCHNGTLRDSDRSRLINHDAFDTDSEAIFHNINLNGIENTSKILGGAYALTWWNAKNNTFNILRNSERPLTFAIKKDGKALYYASEAWMLECAFDRFNIKTTDICNIAEDIHLQIDLGTNRNFKYEDRATKTEMKGYTPPPVTYSPPINYSSKKYTMGNVFGPAKDNKKEVECLQGLVGSYQEFFILGEFKDKAGVWYLEGKLRNSSTKVRVYTGSSLNNALYDLLNDKEYTVFSGKVKRVVDSSYEVYLKFDNRTIKGVQLSYDSWLTNDVSSKAMADWASRVKCGCSWCTYVPEQEDEKKIVWLDNKEFLCATCSEDETTVQYIKNIYG